MKLKSKKYFFDYPDFNNLREVMNYTVEKYADNVAFVIKQKQDKEVSYKKITHKETMEDINCLGTGLFDLGLKDKKIAVISKNRYEWIITYAAVMNGNMIIVPLDKGLKDKEIENSILRVQPDAIVFDNDMEESILNIKENINVKHYICMDDNDKYITINSLIAKGKELIESGNTEYLDVEIDDNKASEYCFTSGTSANSKIVLLSHRNIASNISALHATEQFFPEDVNIALLPLHHTFGSTGTLLLFSYGASTVFCDGLRYLQSNLKEYKVSVFIGVPLLIESMYKKVEKAIEEQGKTKLIKVMRKITNLCPCLKRIVFKPIIEQLGNLRCVISGAAPLDKEVWKAYNELGIKILQGYGLTECSPVVSAENFKYGRKGSIGFPMKGVDVKLIDKNLLGIGELCVKGPNVMLGYYNDDEANKKTFTEDGWLRTGDLAYIDLEGFIFITGRAKNVIVLKNGKNVFPEELEALVNKIPGVMDSMVFGLNKFDDLVVTVKVQYDKEYFKDKKDKEIHDEIWAGIKELNQSLPTYKYIKRLMISDKDFIRTTTAKIKRYEEIAAIHKAELENE